MPETIVQQSQLSQRNLPVLYQQETAQIVQQDPIEGAVQLWATISDQETVQIYQQALDKTWEIIKQAIAIVFFLGQLLIALIIWFGGLAFQLGQILRYKAELEPPTVEQMLYGFLQFLLWPFTYAYDWSVSFIKKHLGWDNPLAIIWSTTKPEDTTSASDTSANSTPGK